MSATCLQNKLGPFIWHFLKSYKKIVFLFVTLAIFAGCWGPFNSILIKTIINVLVAKPSDLSEKLYLMAGLLVLNFIIFDNVTWRTIGFLNYKFQPIIKNEIIKQSFNYTLGASYQYFQDNLSGRISDQIKTLADNIEIILHQISVNFIRAASLLIVSFITSYTVNAMFFYIMLVWFVVFATFSILMSRRLVSLSDKHASNESQLAGQLVDCISNQANVQMFSRRAFEIKRMENFFNRVQKSFQSKEFFILLLTVGQGALIAIMMGFSVYFLIHLYSKAVLTIGDFALILAISMELGHMMWFTMFQVDQFNQAFGKCKQSLAGLIIPHEIEDKTREELVIKEGAIDFTKVKFNYQGAESLFKNKSVTIEAGQKIGLVGYSGGGKSTFVNLILRFFDVVSGQILIDNQDIQRVTQDSLRKAIAMIPQDPTLFHRSLMDNIRYGRIGASDEEVIAASKKAHAHDFICKLSEGYNALVGERGVKLSGGQRQRIAIARAILKNAPVLILDEATSQLDSITEAHIQESLWELMQGKTTLVIAHRLSTLLEMDRILVFDKGHIIQDGNHIELLKEDGLYKKLWDAQVGGFLPDKKTDDNVLINNVN